MVTVLRPLSTSELLDRTFHLYKNHFLLFVGIATLPQLLVLALQLGDAAMLASHLFLAAGTTTVVIWLASLIAVEISHAGTVVAVSDLYLERAAAIGSAYKIAYRSLFRVIGISFVFVLLPALIAGLAIGLVAAIAIPLAIGARGSAGIDNVTLIRLVSGLAALAVVVLIPLIALRWWLSWAVAIPATVIEGTGLRASLRRSKVLTKGSRGRIFIIGLLMIGLAWTVSVIIQLPVIAVAGFRSLRDPSAVTPMVHVMAAIGGFLSASLVGPLLTIALTLIYYDQRVRKEGFDLQLMMAALQPGSQPPAAAAATSN